MKMTTTDAVLSALGVSTATNLGAITVASKLQGPTLLPQEAEPNHV
jgi:hypothetical protein